MSRELVSEVGTTFAAIAVVILLFALNRSRKAAALAADLAVRAQKDAIKAQEAMQSVTDLMGKQKLHNPCRMRWCANEGTAYYYFWDSDRFGQPAAILVCDEHNNGLSSWEKLLAGPWDARPPRQREK